MNALGTAWDLFLAKPYRDGGPPVNGWDIHGLKVGVKLRGTLNHPGDRDDGWTVEMALPWTSLEDLTPDHKPPVVGDHWRMNFSRVEWALDNHDGRYSPRAAPDGHLLPEDNWVWSPQGAINMHMPERWGIVQFGAPQPDPVFNDNDQVKWALRRLYYRERQYRADHGGYTNDLAALSAADIRVAGPPFRPILEATAATFQIDAPGAGGATVHLRDDGRVWITR